MRGEPYRSNRSDSDSAQWEAHTRRATPALGDYVLGFVGFKAALDFTRERHLPSPEAALVINLGAPYSVTDPDRRIWSSRQGSIAAMGLRDQRFIVDTPTGSKNLILVRLTPVGAHLIFGVSMDEVKNRALDLEVLRPRLARDLLVNLDGRRDWHTCFTIVERLLAKYVAEQDPEPAVSRAWQTLYRASGSCSIASIAQQVGLSHKQVIAHFKRKIGLPPKMVARVLRFNKVLWNFGQAERAGWASVAQECGYADQAHLIREFREFAGGTPSDLASLAVAGFTYRD